jgi:hypothetical protein
MGVSLFTALIIRDNEVAVDTYHNEKKTDYGFFVYIKDRGTNTPIFSTLPNFPYKSKKEAKQEGKNFVKEVKKMDIGSQIQKVMSEVFQY